MNSLTKILALASMVVLTASADAQEWVNGAALTGQGTVSAPALLSHETHSGLYLGPSGLAPYASSEASMNLGSGISIGTFSGFAAVPGGTPFGLPGNTLTGNMMPGVSNPMGQSGLSLSSGGPAASSVGGKLSMDLGSGLSVNFVGGVTHDNSNQFYLGPRGALNMSPGGTMSSSIGGGLSMDLGGGQSISVSGIVSKNTASGFGLGPCGGMSAALCR